MDLEKIDAEISAARTEIQRLHEKIDNLTKRRAAVQERIAAVARVKQLMAELGVTERDISAEPVDVALSDEQSTDDALSCQGGAGDDSVSEEEEKSGEPADVYRPRLRRLSSAKAVIVIPTVVLTYFAKNPVTHTYRGYTRLDRLPKFTCSIRAGRQYRRCVMCDLIATHGNTSLPMRTFCLKCAERTVYTGPKLW